MEYLHIDIMLCLKIGIPAASGGLPFSRTMAMAGYPRRGIWDAELFNREGEMVTWWRRSVNRKIQWFAPGLWWWFAFP